MAQQRKQSITWLKAQDITNTRHFIWQGDTIDFNSILQPIDGIGIEDGWIKIYKGAEILDSAYWSYSQTVDTFSIDIANSLLKISLSDEPGTTDVDISNLTAKLDTVVVDSTLTGNGTVASPLSVSSTITSAISQAVYTITLPSASTVAQRCSAAVEGTDYPTGWTISAGTSAVDLKITHNLGRLPAYVTIWSETTGQYRYLIGNAAYSGLFAESDDILRVESLATVLKPLKIQIVFAQ